MCHVLGGQRVHVQHSNPRVLRVPVLGDIG